MELTRHTHFASNPLPSGGHSCPVLVRGHHDVPDVDNRVAFHPLNYLQLERQPEVLLRPEFLRHFYASLLFVSGNQKYRNARTTRLASEWHREELLINNMESLAGARSRRPRDPTASLPLCLAVVSAPSDNKATSYSAYRRNWIW